MTEALNLKIVVILTIGFTLAGLLGYFTQRIKLSPILGYLLAGYMIGPFFPGFVADLELADQLAQVGVMLMMFGVGLHFKWQDLVGVKNIAIPGAIGQTLVTTIIATLFVHYMWGSWQVGVIFGLAIGVASTVVLVRVLADYNLLNTLQGHIAVGWLIVEDILTVAVLILLPTLMIFLTGGSLSFQEIMIAIFWILAKFFFLVVVMFTVGKKFASYILSKVARIHSKELFIVTVLALTFLIATSSAFVFGTSIALGAFIAGMVIGQTEVRYQAYTYALPMRDVFVVIFFLSVGMLFNPMAIFENFSMFWVILFIIMVVKPLAAFLITTLMRYPIQTGLSIAFALAQIGEFSFILAEEANRLNIFPEEGYDIIVACALVSIALNPLFFELFRYVKPGLLPTDVSLSQQGLQALETSASRALVVGLGGVSQYVVSALEKSGYQSVMIEGDVEKIAQLTDKSKGEVESASLLTIAGLNFMETSKIIQSARHINPNIAIIAQAQNDEEKNILSKMEVYVVCSEEEIGRAFDRKIAEVVKEKRSWMYK